MLYPTELRAHYSSTKAQVSGVIRSLLTTQHSLSEASLNRKAGRRQVEW